MSAKLNFVKMHVLGNDFIMLKEDVIAQIPDISYFAKVISNRHTGIGCDQLIFYSGFKQNYRMKILNSDGSHATACGNATQCLASLIFKKHNIDSCNIKVYDRTLICVPVSHNKVSVNMGKASFDNSWMPSQKELNELCTPYGLNSADIICVDVGNPHLVIFNNDLTLQEQILLGNKIEKNKIFPNGVNVNFVTVKDKLLKVKVWERGVGFTLACGTGATASFIASIKLGFAQDSAEVEFDLGRLSLEYKNHNIIITGTTSYVAKGEYYYGI